MKARKLGKTRARIHNTAMVCNKLGEDVRPGFQVFFNPSLKYAICSISLGREGDYWPKSHVNPDCIKGRWAN